MDVSTCSLCAKLGVYTWEFFCTPYQLLLCLLQSCGALDVWSKWFSTQGEAGSCRTSSQLHNAGLRVGFMARVCLNLSYLFWYWHFPCCSLCRSHSSSFWISLRENCSVYRCIFSEWEEGNSGAFWTILVQKPLQIWLLRRVLACRNRDSDIPLEM